MGRVFGLWTVGLIHGAGRFWFFCVEGFSLAKPKELVKARNMAGFFKSQSLLLLEVLDGLGLDEQAELCERIHELAEQIANTLPADEPTAN